MQDALHLMEYDPTTEDSWIFMWGNQKYSSQCYYQLVFENLHSSPVFKLLWKSKCTNRIKFFMWLVLVDRLNTKSMLLRRNYNVQPNAWCVLCHGNVEEDIDHLFFNYPFSLSCWAKLGFVWNLGLDTGDRVLEAGRNNAPSFFVEVFLIAAWEIWNLRNLVIFDNGVASGES
jgi:hypothetical protein